MKTTIAIITAIQTTITIQKISSKSQSICGPKVDMSCGNQRCSSIEASPRKSQSADAGGAFAAQNCLVHGALVRLPVDRFRVIMRIRTSISEMKNLSPPPQLRLNHRRHDAHIL